jgi:hypothetical protein
MKRAKRRRYVPVIFDETIKRESARRKKTETDLLIELSNDIEKKKQKKRKGLFEWDFKV